MVVNEDRMIREVATQEDITVPKMASIMNTISETIMKYLSSATPTESVIVKIVPGISIESKYVEEKTCRHPETQELITAPERIRCKANVTRYYNRKLNRSIKDKKEKTA